MFLLAVLGFVLFVTSKLRVHGCGPGLSLIYALSRLRPYPYLDRHDEHCHLHHQLSRWPFPGYSAIYPHPRR